MADVDYERPDYPGGSEVPREPHADELLIEACKKQLAVSRQKIHEHMAAIDHHLQEKERHQRIGEAAQAALEVLEPQAKMVPDPKGNNWRPDLAEQRAQSPGITG